MFTMIIFLTLFNGKDWHKILAMYMPSYESNETKSATEEFSIKMKGLSLLINAIILQSRSSSFNKYICCQPIVSRIGNVQWEVKRGMNRVD